MMVNSNLQWESCFRRQVSPTPLQCCVLHPNKGLVILLSSSSFMMGGSGRPGIDRSSNFTLCFPIQVYPSFPCLTGREKVCDERLAFQLNFESRSKANLILESLHVASSHWTLLGLEVVVRKLKSTPGPDVLHLFLAQQSLAGGCCSALPMQLWLGFLDKRWIYRFRMMSWQRSQLQVGKKKLCQKFELKCLLFKRNSYEYDNLLPHSSYGRAALKQILQQFPNTIQALNRLSWSTYIADYSISYFPSQPLESTKNALAMPFGCQISTWGLSQRFYSGCLGTEKLFL